MPALSGNVRSSPSPASTLYMCVPSTTLYNASLHARESQNGPVCKLAILKGCIKSFGPPGYLLPHWCPSSIDTVSFPSDLHFDDNLMEEIARKTVQSTSETRQGRKCRVTAANHGHELLRATSKASCLSNKWASLSFQSDFSVPSTHKANSFQSWEEGMLYTSGKLCKRKAKRGTKVCSRTLHRMDSV